MLVDCGRLDPGSSAYDVATEADLLVMVARPVVAEVHHLSPGWRRPRPTALSLLVVGDRPYSVAEVAATVGASPLGTLPVDPRAASVLNDGRLAAARLLRRSPVLRDARALAEDLAGWLPAPGGPPRRTGPRRRPRPRTRPRPRVPPPPYGAVRPSRGPAAVRRPPPGPSRRPAAAEAGPRGRPLRRSGPGAADPAAAGPAAGPSTSAVTT